MSHLRADGKCDTIAGPEQLGTGGELLAVITAGGGMRMKRLTCKGCDVQFVALRADAVTCSPRCRKRYQRICDKINAEMQRPRSENAKWVSYPSPTTQASTTDE